MSTARVVPRDHTTTSTTSERSIASPTPPLVLTAKKTPPARAKLSNSHAASETIFPLGPADLHRVSPVEAKNPVIMSSSGGVDGDCSTESAASSLLQNVKQEDDQVQKKRNRSLFGGRSSPSFGPSDRGSVKNKRYVKMGILLPDSPTEVSVYRSHHHSRNTSISSPSKGLHTPPPMLAATSRDTGTSSCPTSLGTSPSSQNSKFSTQNGQRYHRSSLPQNQSPYIQSEGVTVSIRPYMEDATLVDNELREEGYEVIDLKDVSSIVERDDRAAVVQVQNNQPSPPISVKSESVHSEEMPSSPDSGYGNTPENPNANANDEAKPVEELHQNGVQDLQCQERHQLADKETEGASCVCGENSESVEKDPEYNYRHSGDGDHSNTEQREGGGDKDGEQLTRPSTGSSSSTGVSDSESRGQRSRGDTGDTDESLFSVESIISSAAGDRVAGRENARIFQQQQGKFYLGRQHSIPSGMVSGVATSNSKSSTTPRNVHVQLSPSQQHRQVGAFPIHTSPSTGALSSFEHASRSPNRYSQPVMTSPFEFSELHPSHPSHPSRPHTSTGGNPRAGGLSASQSLYQIQGQLRRQPEIRRKKQRSTSLAFARSTEVRSSRSIKSTALNQDANEKDYFQVTDELAKENSHFALSEALLAVIELYKANQFEQEHELSSPLPPISPLSPLPGQSASTPGSMSDSPGYPSLNWDSSSVMSSGATAGWSTSNTVGGARGWTPPNSVGGASSPAGWPPSGGMSSWDSYSSVTTFDDPNDSSPSRRPRRISLLELISSPTWDNSAESTAQRLLQHMATRLIGSESTESLNMSQMVLKLPTEFLSSLQLDEDLQKSVTTSSAHMRGSKDWAPPRTQIIYRVNTPSKNIQKDLAAQDYRCTGCGMKVDPSQARYFRFCTYTGRYFCPNCHTNATSIIPAYVMTKWSFKRFPVSNYARDLLSKFYSEPVFTAVPRDIYERVPLMAQARDLRRQLVSIKSYLKTCRGAAHLNLTFEGYAPWTIDLTSYSLEDFVEIKGGVKMRHLRSMLMDAVQHVKTCPLCRGKGFVCEFCQNSEDIIFPFELHKVRKCGVCDCCFHKECFGKRQASCPRCLRLQKRLKQRQEETRSPTDHENLSDRDSKTRMSNDYSAEVK